MAFTKSYQIDKAPRKITLKGDPAKPESAQHIIVNRAQAIDDCEGLNACTAQVVDSRIDYEYPANPNVVPVLNFAAVQQIAVRIAALK